MLMVAPAAHAAPSGIRINEIESSGGSPGDWIELFNGGAAEVDLSGFSFADNDDSHSYVFPAGTVVAPGGYLVLDEFQKKTGEGHFTFGLGGADSARLFDASGALVDAYEWSAHAATTFGVNDAGTWSETLADSKGAANIFAEAAPGSVKLNEVDSQPADWVELVNTGGSPLDLSGYELRDNSDDHSWKFPAGATIAPGEYLVVAENTPGIIGDAHGAFGDAIGIGGADRIRLFTPDGSLLDDTGPWEGHAALAGDAALATLARCVDGAGDFLLAHPTPGAPNRCVTDPGTGPGDGTDPDDNLVFSTWPGGADSYAVDTTRMFLADSSGLDTELTPSGLTLWAVDNGEGRFWKLDAASDGSVSFAPGWELGKRARFQRDAANPAAKGPDTEGITAAGDGFIYLASERDNGAKGVDQNTVLKIDPQAPGPDVVASAEWDITALLPAVSANLGIEAVEWVSDAALAGALFDANTGAPYQPANYPGHGDGLFFVAVEDGGQVFAFALNADGSATLVAEVKPGLAGVMALDWDTVRGGLWAVCDDGCDGASAFVTLNGSGTPQVEHFARPAKLPNTNNEGFATSPATTAATLRGDTAMRPVWWFTDGAKQGALQAGTLPSATEQGGGPDIPDVDTPDVDTPGGEKPVTGGPNGEAQDGTGTPATHTKPRGEGLANTGSEASALLPYGVAMLLGAGVLALGLSARSRLRR